MWRNTHSAVTFGYVLGNTLVCIAVLLLFAASGLAIELYQAKEGAVARKQPSTAATVIYRFRPSEEFKVIGYENGEWLKVRFSNGVGYVEEVKATPSVSTTREMGIREYPNAPSQKPPEIVKPKSRPEDTYNKALEELSKQRPNRLGTSQCEEGHWVSSVTDDGGIIILEDGSVWEIDAGDTVDTALWLATEEIIICGDRLINTDNSETAHATRLK